MIDVSVEPSRLVAGQRAVLTIRFANSGRRSCSDVVFKLGVPPTIAIVGGTNRVEITAIAPGRTHVHKVTVEPKKPGEFQLTSTNFSYRDEFDVPVRVTDFRARLSVDATPANRPIARLGVEHAGGELTLGEWAIVCIFVRNTTGFQLSDVTVELSGPLRTDRKRASIAALGNGVTARFAFNVRATESGRQVPVSVRTIYSYRDDLGSVRSHGQEDGLHVVVVKPSELGHQPGTAASAGDQVFVCYSHKDAAWQERLQVHLKPLERAGLIDLWSDRRLKFGDQWRQEIEAALARARVALLLVSADFLASDFIQEMELPKLMSAAEKGGCRIIPILVGPSLFLDTPGLARFMPANPRNATLSEMKPEEGERLLVEVARSLSAFLKAS